MKKAFTLIALSLFLIQSSTRADELDSLKNILKSAKEDTNKAKILLHISEICDEGEILQYAGEGLKLSEKLKFKKGIAGCLNNIGYAYHVTGKATEALENWNRSLEIFLELKDDENIATLYNNIGFVYERQGLIDEALNYYTKSLKIREKQGDKASIGSSLNNMALLYHNHGDYEKSIELNLKNIKVQEEAKNLHALSLAYNNIGLDYELIGKSEEAIDFLKKALQLRLQLKDAVGISDSYINIATTYYENGQIDSNIHYNLEAYKIKESIGDKFGMCTAATSLAITYNRTGNNKLAEEYGILAYKLSKELGYPERIRDAAKILSKIYKENGNYRLAYDMMVFYKQMSDSVNNLSIKNSMVKQQMQYEFDKKEEIAKKDQEQKDLLAAEEKRISRIIIYSVSGGLILLSLMCLFIFRGYKQKKRAHKLISLQKKEVEKQKEIVEQQKEIVEEHQKEILDSINYAKRIQYTLLAHADFLKKYLPDHFVYFNPKDIVSGDFYWAAHVPALPSTNNRELFYIAACDSTGHGVPGAFMSLLNIGFLSEAINEKDIFEPNKVLNYVRMRLTNTISKDGQKDGFDGILVCFDLTNNKITYAAAHNAPVLVRNGELIELNADKMPVGVGERKEDFSLNQLDFVKGDMLYLYTDGFADQFGGPKGKKFKYRPLNEMLTAHAAIDTNEQFQLLKTTFENWKGQLEQVDDVCIIGIRL